MIPLHVDIKPQPRLDVVVGAVVSYVKTPSQVVNVEHTRFDVIVGAIDSNIDP
jgi:hypothetical protein